MIAVQPQVFDLLQYLIANRDRVVSKDDILEAVWGGRIVSESALTTRINATRTAVGDDGDQQRLIRTLPRKGIRFVGVVRERARPLDEAAAAPAVVDTETPERTAAYCDRSSAGGAPPAHHRILRAVARGGGRQNGPGGFKRDYPKAITAASLRRSVGTTDSWPTRTATQPSFILVILKRTRTTLSVRFERRLNWLRRWLH